MTILKLYIREGITPAIRAGVVTLLLVAIVLLAGCSGSQSSTAEVSQPSVDLISPSSTTRVSQNLVSQGSASASLLKPSDAASAVLVEFQGTVDVGTGDGQWSLAQAGQTLTSGQQLRTGALSNATLAFYDGSRIYLGGEAEMALDVLDARTSGARVVQLTQVSGESRHEVVKSDDPASRFVVNTPSGSGNASGTTFTLMVLPGRLSQFWVESGSVSVVNVEVTVLVAAGQTTLILAGQPPIAPAFRISGEGQVIQIATVGGESLTTSVTLPAPAPAAQDNQKGKVTICHATGSATNPYVEISVSAQGAAHGHAKHAGDIAPSAGAGCEQPNTTTTSVTSATSATTTNWNIAGQIFLTGASTTIFGNPQAGDWVRFEGRLLSDGSRFADRIVLMSHSSENQFSFIGQVESVDATVWIVSGRTLQIDQFTEIESGLAVGDSVQVAGAMAEDGIFWATRFNRTESSSSNFRFAGILASMSNEIWVISGMQVTVDASATLYGDFAIGHSVVVEGMIKEDGTWLVTSINLVTPAGYRFEFVGLVQSLSPWTVSGVSFDAADWTEIDADLTVGEQVRVAGMVSADGLWVAERIERLDTEHTTSFDFFGPVLSLNDSWNVRGVLLIVDERTNIKGEISLGEMVKVTGWILADGSWLATEIKHTGLHLGQGCFSISSIVQSVSGDQILLMDGQTLVWGGDLEVQGDLKEASAVRYQFCVDKQGQGKIGRIVVVYQLEALPVVSLEVVPVVSSDENDCQDGPDHDQGKGNDCHKKDKQDKQGKKEKKDK